MRTAAVAAVAAGLLAAAPGLALHGGVQVRAGDRVSARLDPGNDVDTYLVPLASGGRLSVDLRATGDSILMPALAVASPGGGRADLTGHLRGEDTAHLLLRGLPIQVTGFWTVSVTATSGTTGDYDISFATKSPRKRSLRGRTIPPGGTAEVEFAGGEDSVLSLAVVEKRGPPLAEVEVLDPQEEPVPGAAAAISRRGHRWAGRGIVLPGEFGPYVLRLVASGSAATVVDAAAVVKPAKRAHRRITLGPEPRPQGVSPGSGRDGTSVTVKGAGFADGARVYFGDTEAADTEYVSPSELRCHAPDGPESEAGSWVPVEVANADGQENQVRNAFRYLGPPVPTSVSPAFSPQQGGILHTIAGSSFRAGLALTVGGVVPQEISVISGRLVTFRGPPHAPGPVAIVMTDEFGRSRTLNAGLTYVAGPAIAGVSPDSASFTGGRPITVTGSNFRPGNVVSVDRTPAQGVVVSGGTTLTFPMPAGPAGTFDLSVEDEFGQGATAAGAIHRRGPFEDVSASAVPAAPSGTDFFAALVTSGDLDGDGAPDLLLTLPYARYNPYDASYLGARILMNGGSGAFSDATASRQAAFTYPRDYGQSGFAAMGDLDGTTGDEVVMSLRYPLTDPNYVFTKSNGYQYAYYFAGGYYNYRDYRTYLATRVLSNDGAGYLSDSSATALPSPGSTPIFRLGERWQARTGAMGDLDGDGHPDLLLVAGNLLHGYVSASRTYGGVTYQGEAYSYIPSARVLVNDGQGSFTAVAGAFPGPYYQTGTYSTNLVESFDGDAAALGDLDGDGDPDLVLCRSYPRSGYYVNPSTGYSYFYGINATRVLTNDGTGTFAFDATRIPVSYAYSHPGSYDYWQADAVALGDLDGDGDLDVVLGRSGYSYRYDPATYTFSLEPCIRVLANDGSGTFSDATGTFLADGSFRTPGTETILGARSIQIGDLDGDDSPDMVVTGTITGITDYYGTGYGYLGLLPAGPVYATRVLLNGGTGKMKDVTKQWLPTPVNGDRFQADATLLGDLDGDGTQELVLASYYYPDIYGVTSGHNRPLRILSTR